MEIEYEGATDIGLTRLNNEDVFAILEKEQFFALADGMGGHNAGEVAAAVTIQELCKSVQSAKAFSPSPKDWIEILRDAIFDANLHVYQMGEQNIEQQGMGTTLCLGLIAEKKLIIAHVGDSRIYRFRKGRLTRLTQDHSLKGELIASGKLDEESARHFPKKNVITRAIGTQMTVDPDFATFDIEEGDLYLLCSDGLTDPLSDSQIADFLELGGSASQITKALILAAKKAGGTDNITLISFRILF